MNEVITKLICFIVLLPLLVSCGTMMGAKAPIEMRSIEQIIDIPNMTKENIYIKANSWFVETFNSAESVIEFQDKENGKIMGKYVYSYSEGVYTYDVRQVVDISIKDNKIKVSISNPYYKATSGLGEKYTNTVYRLLETQTGIDKARIEWKKLIESLVEYIKVESEW